MTPLHISRPPLEPDPRSADVPDALGGALHNPQIRKRRPALACPQFRRWATMGACLTSANRSCLQRRPATPSAGPHAWERDRDHVYAGKPLAGVVALRGDMRHGSEAVFGHRSGSRGSACSHLFCRGAVRLSGASDPDVVAHQADLVAAAWSPAGAPPSWRLTAAQFEALRDDRELLMVAAAIPPDRLPRCSLRPPPPSSSWSSSRSRCGAGSQERVSRSRASTRALWRRTVASASTTASGCSSYAHSPATR
jgi:hypothetical protein